jgi:glutathionylspermidine amidase/synthetase
VGLDKVGGDPGAELMNRLVAAWTSVGLPASTLVHFMHDNDIEEHYHSLYMMHAAEQAGLRCKRVAGVAGLKFNEHGRIVDDENNVIAFVWKTWSYTTLFGQWQGNPVDLYYSLLIRIALITVIIFIRTRAAILG